MEKEWSKELPPFEKNGRNFLQRGFDPDGDIYITIVWLDYSRNYLAN